MKDLSNCFFELSQKLLGEKYEAAKEESYTDNLASIESARQDWLAAITLFNNVCDKELIDWAIYNLNAAERRYVFLLKEARERKNSKRNIIGKENG